jgi:hypothetical protein
MISKDEVIVDLQRNHWRLGVNSLPIPTLQTPMFTSNNLR